MSDSTIDTERRKLLQLISIGATVGIAGCNQMSQDNTSASQSTQTLTPQAEPTPSEIQTTQPESLESTDVMVEMRDGVQLATDVYRPAESGPHPTLLWRTPYDKSDDRPMIGPDLAVSNGYALVKQDVRGRFNSEGTLKPFYEGKDGNDTIGWIADQRWSNENVGMFGISYRGMATWQAAVTDPKPLKVVLPVVTPSDYYEHTVYSGGAFNVGAAVS